MTIAEMMQTEATVGRWFGRAFAVAFWAFMAWGAWVVFN